MAYARRIFGAKGRTKKDIALDLGYSANTANSVASHIESKPGFKNAMAKLAAESNNLALNAMAEFKARGFAEFSNKDLISALNAIGAAWERFNKAKRGDDGDENPRKNRLRTVILQQIENQNVRTIEAETSPAKEEPKIIEAVKEDLMDF